MNPELSRVESLNLVFATGTTDSRSMIQTKHRLLKEWPQPYLKEAVLGFLSTAAKLLSREKMGVKKRIDSFWWDLGTPKSMAMEIALR